MLSAMMTQRAKAKVFAFRSRDPFRKRPTNDVQLQIPRREMPQPRSCPPHVLCSPLRCKLTLRAWYVRPTSFSCSSPLRFLELAQSTFACGTVVLCVRRRICVDFNFACVSCPAFAVSASLVVRQNIARVRADFEQTLLTVLTLNVLYMYYIDHKLLVLFIRASQVIRVSGTLCASPILSLPYSFL